MEATKKRSAKLEAKGDPVDFKELLRMTAPPDEALELQRRPPDGMLRIVARGIKEDAAAA